MVSGTAGVLQAEEAVASSVPGRTTARVHGVQGTAVHLLTWRQAQTHQWHGLEACGVLLRPLQHV